MLPPEGVMSVAEKKENTITKTGNHHRTEWNFGIGESGSFLYYIDIIFNKLSLIDIDNYMILCLNFFK
jgi:hypothetical protein